MNLPSAESFTFKEGVIGGDECILIVPNDIKCEWTEDNLQFRSMIIRKSDNKIISRGFNKFFNLNEHPELDVFPHGKFTVVEKYDGSLLIWGMHNGEMIHRTRGTFDASTHQKSGHEIELLKKKYPEFMKAITHHPEYSFLTEWETKANVIVINRVEEPTLSLVGVINNETGMLLTQHYLDSLSEFFGLERPKTYHFSNIHECASYVNLWSGREGVVIYSGDGQHLRKVKSDWYCSLHAIASGMFGTKKVLDLFMSSPQFQEWEKFYDYVATTIDYEVAEKIKDDIKKATNAYNKYLELASTIRHRVDMFVRPISGRREQALHIQEDFRGWGMSYAFEYLDNKPTGDKIFRKAMETLLDL